ncbi:hypothetical protein G7Y89_g15447 [Cudoniella acicularis]|uniref:CCHC-type domain-containing protein n=1 Tax=Cudoniella acicularis TaxID=354080 RepID=A0A8H4VLU4_9HELO|nr:hypothetical protein G7Y89_g15447 [Cudoniella acicularis]
MAGMSSPSGAPKAMSSRLLTMKFMQRAAASLPTTSSPSTTDEPPNKRRRTEVDSCPPTFNVNALADQRAIQKAVADEEAKRQAALEKQAAEAGDTRWVLSFEDQNHAAAASSLALRVVPTGFAVIDSLSPLQIRSLEEEAEDKPIMVGRRSFGKFNRVLEKQQDPTIEESSSSDSEEDDDSENDSDADSDDPANELIKASRKEAAERAKAERKAKKRAEKAKALDLAKQRKKKDVNLNGLTSLSGKAGTPTKGPCYKCGGPHMKSQCPKNDEGQEIPRRPQSQDIKCYNCGGPHLKSQCPDVKRGHSGGDEGPSRKLPRTR